MSSNENEYKQRQLKVVLFLLERIFGKRIAEEIARFIQERFSMVLEESMKKRYPYSEPARPEVEVERERRPYPYPEPRTVPIPTPFVPSPVVTPSSEWVTTSSTTTWTEPTTSRYWTSSTTGTVGRD